MGTCEPPAPSAGGGRLLVGPAQRQTDRDCHLRRALVHERRREAALVVTYVLEGIELLGFDLELAAQSLDQARSVGGSTRHEHLVDVIHGARGLEEVESLLDLQAN